MKILDHTFRKDWKIIFLKSFLLFANNWRLKDVKNICIEPLLLAICKDFLLAQEAHQRIRFSCKIAEAHSEHSRTSKTRFLWK